MPLLLRNGPSKSSPAFSGPTFSEILVVQMPGLPFPVLHFQRSHFFSCKFQKRTSGHCNVHVLCHIVIAMAMGGLGDISPLLFEVQVVLAPYFLA